MIKRIKRILIHSAPPWACSGYGLQCRYLAQALKQLGYDVAISAGGGVHESRPWNGYPILSCAGRPYGNGVIAGNYRKWKAGLMILLGDLWVIDPVEQQFAGLNVMPILPVDCEPLSVLDKHHLGLLKGPLLHPVAMSEFGRRMLTDAGYDAPVLPHCTKFRPDPAAGLKWRREMQVPDELFLVVKVGVNNVDDRKAFSVTLQAFAEFTRDRADVGLYLHTEPQVRQAPNLAYMAQQLGLMRGGRSKVVFPDEFRRATDDYDQNWMHGMYNAADVLDSVTKGEGFCCPAIDALACGTPIIAATNSALPEKMHKAYGWLVDGQREWAPHHNAWWQTPYAGELAEAYADAYRTARGKRDAAGRAGQRWTYDAMKATLKSILEEL